MDGQRVAAGKLLVATQTNTAAASGFTNIPETGFRVVSVFVHDLNPRFGGPRPAHALIRSFDGDSPSVIYRADREESSLTSWITFDREGERFPTDHNLVPASAVDYAVYDAEHSAEVEAALGAGPPLPQLSLFRGTGTELEA
jgi:hypothetical protein